jgi:hypothetical protein
MPTVASCFAHHGFSCMHGTIQSSMDAMASSQGKERTHGGEAVQCRSQGEDHVRDDLYNDGRVADDINSSTDVEAQPPC